MNMRGDNNVKRRGKTKQFRGKHTDLTSGYMRMADFNWGSGNAPSILHAFNENKGHWTYPKKGFIQWKNE